MEIQTYEVEEHTTEGRDAFEIEAEAQALIEEMGLAGQKALLSPSEDGVETATRLPYRVMTREEVRVYQTLYPETSNVEDYRAGPIPLRVLQVIAHARTLFDTIEVWGPQTQDPDPVLVGHLTTAGAPERYLLARWGDALEPFEDLVEKAVARLAKKWKAKAEKIAAECMAFMDAPEHDVREHLSGEWVYKPWTT